MYTYGKAVGWRERKSNPGKECVRSVWFRYVRRGRGMSRERGREIQGGKRGTRDDVRVVIDISEPMVRDGNQ